MSIPIESADIRGVYLKDKAGVRAYQIPESRLPARIQDIRRRLAEKWARQGLRTIETKEK